MKCIFLYVFLQYRSSALTAAFLCPNKHHFRDLTKMIIPYIFRLLSFSSAAIIVRLSAPKLFNAAVSGKSAIPASHDFHSIFRNSFP